MNRFRFTLLAVCLLLLWLGAGDLALFLRNQAPVRVSVAQLLGAEAPDKEWLTLTEGSFDLQQAISTSGTLEVDALLIPMYAGTPDGRIRLLVESRDPELLEHFRTYHFLLNSADEQAAYAERYQDSFRSRQARTGMRATGRVANSNRKNLMQLAQEVGMAVEDDVIFFTEGMTPPVWQGFFFVAIGLAGLVRVLLLFRRRPAPPTAQTT